MPSEAQVSRLKIKKFMPMLAMMAAIFYVSHQPGDNLHIPSGFGIDKLCHFIEYGLLAATCIYGFMPVEKENARKIGVIVVTICLLFAISDEIHQSFVPLRESSVADIIADVSGAIMIVLLWLKTGMPLKLLKI